MPELDWSFRTKLLECAGEPGLDRFKNNNRIGIKSRLSRRWRLMRRRERGAGRRCRRDRIPSSQPGLAWRPAHHYRSSPRQKYMQRKLAAHEVHAFTKLW